LKNATEIVTFSVQKKFAVNAYNLKKIASDSLEKIWLDMERILNVLSFQNRLQSMFCADFEAHISAGQVLHLFSAYFSLLKPIAVPESVRNMRMGYIDKASI